MAGSGPSILLAAIAGFLLGAFFVDAVEDVGRVVITLGAIGGFAGAGIAGVLDRDVTRWGAIGGGLGLALGVLVAIVDAIVGG